jgi:hypothetical protein
LSLRSSLLCAELDEDATDATPLLTLWDELHPTLRHQHTAPTTLAAAVELLLSSCPTDNLAPRAARYEIKRTTLTSTADRTRTLIDQPHDALHNTSHVPLDHHILFHRSARRCLPTIYSPRSKVLANTAGLRSDPPTLIAKHTMTRLLKLHTTRRCLAAQLHVVAQRQR